VVIASKGKKMSKPQEQQAETKIRPEANPICDIMASKKRRLLVVSPEEREAIRQLHENPPPPTEELIRAYREYKKTRQSE
jgi:hypothetical protein